MKTFKVNEKEYVAKAFDFNLICDLEDMGVSLQDAGKKPMVMIRAYFSLCAGKGTDFAGKELEVHMMNGGSFDEIATAMSEEMEKSDFFRNLNKTEETEIAESKKTKK